MKVTINRPEQCPHYSRGYCHNLCGYPSPGAPLYCDTAPSAVGADGFPLNCPLRMKEGMEV